MPPVEQQGSQVPVEPTPPVMAEAKHSKAPLFIILAVVLFLGIAAGVAYFVTKQKSSPSTPLASDYYAPSIIDKAKDATNWQNGLYVVEGGHGLPEVRGSFVKTANGTFTSTDINQKVVEVAAEKLAAMPPAESYSVDEVTQRVTLKGDVAYQLDMLGLLNQLGYGLDDNLVTYFNNLLTKVGGTVADDAEAQACSVEQPMYRKKANDYLRSLTPNYVLDQKYNSLQWRIDTTELFNRLSIKANAPACYAYLDKYMQSNVENDRLADTQLIFQYDDSTKPEVASIKVFVAPPLPSEKYEKVFGVELNVASRNTPKNTSTPPTDTAKVASLFNRQSAFTIATSNCGNLPVIGLAVGSIKNAYVTPVQTARYKGPQLRDLGYYCTEVDAKVDGYQAVSN